MKAYEKAVQGLKDEIEWKSQRHFPDEAEIQRLHQMLATVEQNRQKIDKNPLLQKMERVVNRVLKHYFLDFYYYDIMLLEREDYNGRILWYVSKNGTHLLRETEEELMLKNYIDRYYSYHACFLIEDGMLKKVNNPENLDWCQPIETHH